MAQVKVLFVTARLYSEQPAGRQRQLVLLADRMRREGIDVSLFSAENRLHNIGAFRPQMAFLRGLRAIPPGKLFIVLSAVYLRVESAMKRGRKSSRVKLIRHFFLLRLSRLMAVIARAIFRIGAGDFSEDELISEVIRQEPGLAFQSLEVVRVIRKIRPDYVVGFGRSSNVPVVIAASITGTKNIVSERVGAVYESKNYVEYAPLRVYQRATLITANNRKVVQVLESLFPDNRVAYTGNILEPSGQTNGNRREPAVCVAARLIERKRVDEIILAVRKLLDHGITLPLTIFGSGPQKPHLEKLAQDLGLSNQVSFAGWVPLGKIHFGNYRFFISNGRNEGASNSLEQAIQEGVIPIVAIDGGNRSSTAAFKRIGELTTDGSANQIFNKLQSLCLDLSFLSRAEKNVKLESEELLEGSAATTKLYLDLFQQSARRNSK